MKSVVSLAVLLTAMLVAGLTGASAAHGSNEPTRIFGPDSTAPTQSCWYGICPNQPDQLVHMEFLSSVGASNSAQMLLNPSIDWRGYPIQYAVCYRFPGAGWQSCVRANHNVDGTGLEVDILLEDTQIYLGDVVGLLGNPGSVTYCAGYVPDISSQQEGIRVTLEYPNGLMIFAYRVLPMGSQRIPSSEWRVRSDMRVAAIEYHPMDAFIGRHYDGYRTFRWTGFRQGFNLRPGCGGR